MPFTLALHYAMQSPALSVLSLHEQASLCPAQPCSLRQLKKKGIANRYVTFKEIIWESHDEGVHLTEFLVSLSAAPILCPPPYCPSHSLSRMWRVIEEKRIANQKSKVRTNSTKFLNTE
jgi:hypothetical protein